MDIQKKILQHNMTGRECRRDTRGLAGLPLVSAEVLEGYFNGWGCSPWEMWGLNPKLGSPALSTRARKEPRYQPIVKSIRGSVGQGETAGEAESLLKGQSTKFCLQPLTLGTSKRRAERTKRHLRRVWGWWVWGEKWRNSHQDPCAKSFSTGRSYYLRQNTLLWMASAWGEAIPPPAGITLPKPVVLKTGCWS